MTPRRRLAAAIALLGMGTALGSWTGQAAAAVDAGIECAPACAVPAGAVVTFTSTATSTTPIRNYEWDLDGDGLFGAADDPDEPYGPRAMTATRAFPQPGEQPVSLRVTNARAEQATATRTVTVTAAGAPPGAPPPVVPPGLPAGTDPLRPPLPAGDEDGDGVGNGRDLCPATAPATRARLHGCSLVDAIVSPGALLAGAGTTVGRLRGDLGLTGRLRRASGAPLARVAAGLAGIEVAGRLLAAEPCAASRRARRAVGTAGRGIAGVGQALAAEQRRIVLQIGGRHARRPATAGDTDGLDARYLELAATRDDAADAGDELSRLAGLMGAACRATGGAATRTISGRVVAIDSRSSTATLADGTVVALGAASRVDGLGTGVSLRVRGVPLRGGILVADSAIASGLVTALPGLLPCTMRRRIAPVQDFASWPSYLYYDPRGYLDGDTYKLEGGMAINAVRAESCAGYDDFRLQMLLTYHDASGAKITKKLIGSVRGLPESDPPAWIPEDVDPNTKANPKALLRFRLWGYDCADASLSSCSMSQLISEDEWKVELRAKGGWGTALYDRTRYSVEDGSTTDFDTATLVGVNTPPGVLPSPTIFGVGYGVGGGGSTFPQAQYIVDDQAFAVHDDVPAVTAEDYEDDAKGVPGGLLWAYVHGLRDGRPYHYWARLPQIVTDVVSVCPGKAEDSYYRLPWKPNSLQQVTQGNNTDFTHKDDPATPTSDQRYAFDLKMKLKTTGRAARGGLVDWIEEDFTETSDPKASEYWFKVSNGAIDLYKPANALRVTHQDGTHSWYLHMIPGGVLPAVDDIVDRGDDVIVVGNTGNSTGAHLHYHVTDRQDKGTIRIRFELNSPFTPAGPPLSCVIPGKGAYFSTNS